MLVASMLMAVEPNLPVPAQRRDDLAAIKMSVDEDDLSMSFQTRVRFPAGQKAGGAVGAIGLGNRQLQMTFTPVKGQASLYRIDAQWCSTDGEERKQVFVAQALAAYGQTATLSQFGQAGKFTLEVTIEPERLILGAAE